MKNKDKLTQRKGVFYLLWKSHKETPEEYLPAWRFTGEFFIKEIGKWCFLSYKGPTNGLAIYFENPGLIERRMTTGKTGAKYYEYRIVVNPTFDLIKDEEIREFTKVLERAYKLNPPRNETNNTMESK